MSSAAQPAAPGTAEDADEEVKFLANHLYGRAATMFQAKAYVHSAQPTSEQAAQPAPQQSCQDTPQEAPFLLPRPALPTLPKWPSFRRPWMLRRESSESKRPWRLRMAEQLVGSPVIDAAETIRREILQQKDQPQAIIRFLLKAAAGVAIGWAQSHANRVFAVFGAYVVATCGLLAGAKRLLKFIVRRLPPIFGFRLIKPVSFATDVLFPTGFFGPYLAAYVAVRLVLAAASEKETERKAVAADAERAPTAYDPFDSSDDSDLAEAEAEPYPSTASARNAAADAAEVAAASRRWRARAALHRRLEPAGRLVRQQSLTRSSTARLRHRLPSLRPLQLPSRSRAHAA